MSAITSVRWTLLIVDPSLSFVTGITTPSTWSIPYSAPAISASHASREGIALDNMRPWSAPLQNLQRRLLLTGAIASLSVAHSATRPVSRLPHKLPRVEFDRPLRRRGYWRASFALDSAHAAARTESYVNGSSSMISLSRGAVPSRSDGISSSSGRGHRMPTSGSLYAMPRSVASM
jgi:hypothetical protein